MNPTAGGLEAKEDQHLVLKRRFYGITFLYNSSIEENFEKLLRIKREFRQSTFSSNQNQTQKEFSIFREFVRYQFTAAEKKYA